MQREELVAEHLRQPAMTFTVGQTPIVLVPKEFSSGSLGWHGQAKSFIGDTKVQVNFMVTVIGSKPNQPNTGEVQSGGTKPAASLPGEQNGTMPKNVPEGPPSESPLFGDPQPKKKLKKRS